jgi:aminoglycoside 6'-N-acetyltransferase I
VVPRGRGPSAGRLLTRVVDTRVEPVGRDDASAVSEMLARFFREEGFEVPGEGLAPRLERYLSLPHHAAFVARDGERLVGVATVTSNFGLEYGWAAELEDLYVVPEARGHRVGRTLVEAAASWARGDECTALLVTVTPEGQQAHDLVAFYRRLGFADDGRKILELDLGT